MLIELMHESINQTMEYQDDCPNLLISNLMFQLEEEGKEKGCNVGTKGGRKRFF